MSIKHRIAHWFHWNHGSVDTFWQGRQLMIGFRCAGCGKLLHVHAGRTTRNTDTAPR